MKHSLIIICLSFLVGIIAGFYLQIPFLLIISIAVILFLLCVFSFYRSKKSWNQNHFFGLFSIFLFIWLGVITVQIHLPENQPQHYLNHINAAENAVHIKIIEELKPDLYNQKFIATVEAVNRQSSHGKLLLLNPKVNEGDSIKVGDELYVYAGFEAIPKPLNPHQFNYSQYLSNKRIYRQAKLNHFNFSKSKKSFFSLRGIAATVRSKIIKELERNGYKDNELAIIQALFLGEKKDVSKQVYESYANAGVIHILAVSGLHVGIILMILSFALAPIKKFKYGPFLYLFILVLLLWCFAFIAGLSPSIIRAVTMFTFVAIGISLKRKGYTLHSVFASMLILLLVNPFFIFEVGFQLSYLAVIAIVIFQPIIYNFLKPKNRVIEFFWKLFSVTLAAQIGVLPLSLFYFHQFPGLFFLSNLIILPVLGLILGLGILVIALALLNILPSFAAKFFNYVIAYLNALVNWVSQQENFIFKDISFSAIQVIAAYIVLIFLFFLLNKFSTRKLTLFLLSTILFQTVYIFEKQKNVTAEFIVFHNNRNTLIGFKKQDHLTVFSDTELNVTAIENYEVAEGINTRSNRNITNILIFQNKKILIVDSLGIYDIGIKADILILKNSPKINLERLITTVEPKEIIADGSNFPSLVLLWKETSMNQKVPFHDTREKGAFLVEY